MAPPRKPLTVERKYQIIQLLDKGVSHRKIAKKYHIGHATVCAINSNREEIIELIMTTTSSVINANSPRTDKELNRLLRRWYIQCIVKSKKLTESMIQQKAQELNKQLKGSSAFTASLRWVARFRKNIIFHKEDIPKQVAVDIFNAEFNKLIQTEGYKLENVYNADTTRLLWKAVPETTLLSQKVKSLETKGKDQVTVFLCTNATGCHKVPVATICPIQEPPSAQCSSAKLVSIMHRTDTRPYMNSNIFNEWFNKCFLKDVTERQQKNGHREKTLLLLNNTGLEQENRIISTKDEFVKIMYFSCDIAPLIQPMDRGIIACFKRMFRNAFLDSLIPTSNKVSEEELTHIYSNLKMDNYCSMVHNAWLKVNNPILKNAWSKLLRQESEQSPEDSQIIKRDINEALEKLNKIPGCRGCDDITVMNWFETDKKHNNDMQVDIQNTLLDFINVAMDTQASEIIDENFEDILNNSSS